MGTRRWRKLLLEKGADVEPRNTEYGQTPLGVGCREGVGGGGEAAGRAGLLVIGTLKDLVATRSGD
jgi:hypothetical protein